MSCFEEWGRLQKAILKLIDGMAYEETLRHQCNVHKDEASCKEWYSGEWAFERTSRKKEFIDTVTDLSRCIERAVRT